MQLYVDSYGASLRVKNKMFWIKPRRSEGQVFAVREVNAIFLTKGVFMSSNALLMAIDNNIPVLLINGIGHLVGQVWSGQYGSIASIRKQQALLTTHYKGLDWIRQLLIQKLESQRGLLLRWVEKSEIQDRERLDGGIRVIYNMTQKYKSCVIQQNADLEVLKTQFRGWEGTASRHYFLCLSALLPVEYQFKNRSKRPAYDNFNALLYYLFGILYSQIHLALMKAGLDPFMSIFHADQHNKPTFVYDVIEIYRHWMEEVAMQLCCEGKLTDDAFYLPDDRTGIWLHPSAKPIVVNTCFAFLNEKVNRNGKPRKRITHIDLDAQSWANDFKQMVLD